MIKSYLVHMRPKTFLPSFVFVLTGYALNPLKASLSSIMLEIIYLFGIYSVLLFGGTCALNSHFDRDEGPLNFLENPPEKPRYLGYYGLALMLLACMWSSVFGFWPLMMTLFATLLSIAYSVKFPSLKWRGKEIGGMDILIDSLGCGLVAVILGATIGGAAVPLRTWWVAIAFTVTVAGSYPATQIFQLKMSDDYKSARNFSSLVGAAKALQIGSALLLLGFGIIINVLLFSKVSPIQWLFYGVFFALFLLGVLRCLKWSKAPFENSTRQFKSVIFTLLGARLLWIIAECLSST